MKMQKYAALFLFFLFACAIFVFRLFGQNLWQDHNPYAVGSNLRQGTILKLNIDEVLEIVYQYENQADENLNIQLLPDRAITSFLPPANSDRSIVKNYKNRVNSRSRIRMRLAVRLDADPQSGVASFQGTKFITHENNISRQRVEVKGQVHVEDIASGRRIHSQDVADLQILIVGVPVPRSANLPLPPPQSAQDQGAQGQGQGQTQGQGTQTQPGGQQAKESSLPALSEEQKRQLLWQYINRILGETSSQ